MDGVAASPVLLGLLGSLAAGLMTAVGALLVLVGPAPDRATRDGLLGFAAGVMLATSFFSLILPALDGAERLYGPSAIPAAVAAGAMLYVISHEIIPETHEGGHQRRATAGLGLGFALMLFLDVWLAPAG